MIETLPPAVQTLLFLGLIVLWVRLTFQFVRWLIAAVKDEGMM